MAKSKPTPKKVASHMADEKGVNWALVGGIIGIGAIIVVVLILLTTLGGDEGALTLRDRQATIEAEATESVISAAVAADRAQSELAAYCSEHPLRCLAQGATNAPVTMYEVSDYGCPACKTFNQTTLADLKSQYIDTGIVQFIELPSAPLGNPTGDAAEAVLCGAELGAGPEFHKGMFDIQIPSNTPRKDDIIDLAVSLGIDRDAFEQCYDSGRYSSDVIATTALVRDLGVSSTPSFFVNGEIVVGANLTPLAQAIESKTAE